MQITSLHACLLPQVRARQLQLLPAIVAMYYCLGFCLPGVHSSNARVVEAVSFRVERASRSITAAVYTVHAMIMIKGQFSLNVALVLLLLLSQATRSRARTLWIEVASTATPE
jgi:hypothetical protein